MKKSVRAAGLTAALAAFGLLALLESPLQAVKADIGPAIHYLDHGSAAIAPAAFGMNDLNAGAPIRNQAEIDRHAVAQMMGHAVRLADAAVPRPRTLDELVGAYARTETADDQEECLANTVYFEARGEPIAGQLAVAEVVLNRVADRKYPDTICEVVFQPWQFSYIHPRTGRFPTPNRTSDAWRKSVAIARITMADRAASLPRETLWYHADYVAPGWGKRLNRETKIGLHIFYT